MIDLPPSFWEQEANNEMILEAIEDTLKVFGKKDPLKNLVVKSVDILFKEKLELYKQFSSDLICKSNRYEKEANELRSENYNMLEQVEKSKGIQTELYMVKLELKELQEKTNDYDDVKEERNTLSVKYKSLSKASPENLANLVERNEILTALENGGVDNWEWYGQSIDDHFGQLTKPKG